MSWTGSRDDLASWLVCDDAAIERRAQDVKVATILEAGGEIG